MTEYPENPTGGIMQSCMVPPVSYIPLNRITGTCFVLMLFLPLRTIWRSNAKTMSGVRSK
jgi:hypothetical protein